MRLRLECPTRPPFWIIGDPLANARTEQSPAYNIGLQVTRNTQTVTGAEFETRMQFDRGNQGVSFDGTCNRIFATQLERLAFIASLAPILSESQAHEWEGTAYLREDDGAAYLEYELPECTLALMGINLRGAVGLDLTYRVQAGGFGSSAEGVSLIKLLAAENTGYGIVLFGTSIPGPFTNSTSPTVDTVTGLSLPTNWELNLVITSSEPFSPRIRGPYTQASPLMSPLIADSLDALALVSSDSAMLAEAITLEGRAAVKFSIQPAFMILWPDAVMRLEFSATGPTRAYTADAFTSALAVTALVSDSGVLLLADSAS